MSELASAPGDWARAGEILALGHSHRALLRPLHVGEEGVYPHFVSRVRGCELVDVEGRTYVDWMHGTAC